MMNLETSKVPNLTIFDDFMPSYLHPKICSVSILKLPDSDSKDIGSINSDSINSSCMSCDSSKIRDGSSSKRVVIAARS
jgi:hypothetical protein